MKKNNESRRAGRAGKLTALLVALAASSITFMASPAAAHHENGNSTYYEHTNAGGAQTTVWPGEWIDLRYRDMCNWWWCISADNVISSVRTEGSATILYTGSNFDGTSVCVQGHRMVNLPWFMADQVSSVRVLRGDHEWQRACPSHYEGQYLL